MELQEALEIVSYKTALKKGEEALADKVLLPDTIQQAILDQAEGNARSIGAKDYIQATKLVREHRSLLYKKENEDFLADNATKAGIQTTPSGLQFHVLTQGQGEKPTPDGQVTVHYRGTLIDGTEFDSSHQRGKESTFSLSKVIKGWCEGVLLMNPGSTFCFYIPHELAYGERGLDPKIPPYSTLIIEVELLSIP